jgi:hypothetical protein
MNDSFISSLQVCDFAVRDSRNGEMSMPQNQWRKNNTIFRQHQYTTIEYMTGPSRKGPKRCLHCHKPFKKGEPWQRITSPADPQHGAYAVGIHAACLR